MQLYIIQTLALKKSLSSEHLDTPQDIIKIRAQLFALKSNVIWTFFYENSKNMNNELAQGYGIIESLMEIQSIVFDSLLAPRNSPTISDLRQQQQQSTNF